MTNRRNFITKTAAAVIASTAIPNIISSAFAAERGKKKITLDNNSIVLLQGDSITDWGRDKKENTPNTFGMLGTGYAYFTGAGLLDKYANKGLQVWNRGISGNKVYQLAERWDNDCLNIKPNVLSILIGVNDFWHTLSGGYTGTVDKYRTDYKALLDRTMKALPNVKLIIGEPFALKGVKAVDDKWYPAFDEYRTAAREIATQYDAVFIPYQSIFDKALEVAPGSYWTTDGVHPNVAGAHMMAQAWLEVVKG
ncbi:SGNH/GDSL hydrolase family protein [Mucilaginibacter sp. KACC 22063]|uniref:SGNH/GDSL hydrolase family protein n=1 Tax=Mucilaginibacter sp. KACC 22063 TaxID=3025666 RepID=UPI00236563F3|nr:SGNH/GDSL hydrolase family protein [Mucilaginibacter sp. KACC 22063]WDF56909.1 SGNH/GDSL hydrolase family protein [Mucilaginibacter sp. KACC 22063]